LSSEVDVATLWTFSPLPLCGLFEVDFLDFLSWEVDVFSLEVTFLDFFSVEVDVKKESRQAYSNTLINFPSSWCVASSCAAYPVHGVLYVTCFSSSASQAISAFWAS
jgi:hypothetical protein